MSDDPTAYVDCASNGRLEHCGVDGFTFIDEQQACMQKGDPAASLTVDSISQQSTDPATTINVGLTYSGSRLGALTVRVADAADASKVAFSTPTPAEQLISDGRPHGLAVSADSHNVATAPPMGFWEPQSGEQIQVDAQLAHTNPNPADHAPLFAAVTTRTLTLGGSPPGPPTPTNPVLPPSPGPPTPTNPPVPPRPSLPTNWSGSWTSGGYTAPARLTLESTQPLAGTFDIQGLCSAHWMQEPRTSDGYTVIAAHVISGTRCADIRWDVTVERNRITGFDMLNGGTTFTLTPE